MGWAVGSGRGKEPTRLLLSAASPPCTATGTLSIEILEVNDHAPELSPPSGSLCSEPDQGSGLLLGAVDEDLPPHGAPFHFQLSPRVPELARNWSLNQINSELQPPHPGVPDLGPEGHMVPLVPTSAHPQVGQGLVIPSGQMGKQAQHFMIPTGHKGGMASPGHKGAWPAQGDPADLRHPPQ